MQHHGPSKIATSNARDTRRGQASNASHALDSSAGKSATPSRGFKAGRRDGTSHSVRQAGAANSCESQGSIAQVTDNASKRRGLSGETALCLACLFCSPLLHITAC